MRWKKSDTIQVLWAISIPGIISESKLGPKIEQKLRLKTLFWQTRLALRASELLPVKINILAIYPGKNLSRTLQKEYEACFKPFQFSWIKSTDLAGKEVQYLWDSYSEKFDRLLYTNTNTPLLRESDFRLAFSSGETAHIYCDNGSIAMVAGGKTLPFKTEADSKKLLPSLKTDYLAIAQIILLLEEYAKSDPEFYEPIITYMGSLFESESTSE